MSQNDFSQLPLVPALHENLSTLGYQTMTPVQAQSLPEILAGKDLIAQAKTGSGKTVAFALGVLQHIEPKNFHVQSLILCPTRELADQVAGELRKLARALPNIKVLTLCGGTPVGPQIGSLAHGAHIIVGTPGRVEDHLRKGTLSLAQVGSLVLDEADRMLDMGFQQVLDTIVEHLPAKRQNLLFSATFPKEIERISQRIMTRPLRVTVAAQHNEASIKQQFVELDNLDRSEAAALLLLTHRPDSALVFCNTKKETSELARALRKFGLSVAALHGDLEQRERDQTLIQFANRSVAILVATDVAARGLDVEAVDLVLNYQIARELAVHTHRVGRTGRAGLSGLALTLVEPKERSKLDRLEELMQQPIETVPLPEQDALKAPGYKAPMATVQIDGGKKQKVRPGDILGALTAPGGLTAKDVGKIHLQDQKAYVAVVRPQLSLALDLINKGKLKGRNFRARSL